MKAFYVLFVLFCLTCLTAAAMPVMAEQGGNCPNAFCVAGCGDINADGQILASDALAVIRTAVGLENPAEFDCRFDNDECRGEDDSDSQ